MFQQRTFLLLTFLSVNASLLGRGSASDFPFREAAILVAVTKIKALTMIRNFTLFMFVIILFSCSDGFTGLALFYNSISHSCP